MAKRRTKAFCASVPSRKEIEIVSPGCHLLFLTRAAFAAPVVGGAAANHAKHHLSALSIVSSLALFVNVPNGFALTSSRIPRRPTVHQAGAPGSVGARFLFSEATGLLCCEDLCG